VSDATVSLIPKVSQRACESSRIGPFTIFLLLLTAAFVAILTYLLVY
jgi:hypothetical protein